MVEPPWPDLSRGAIGLAPWAPKRDRCRDAIAALALAGEPLEKSLPWRF